MGQRGGGVEGGGGEGGGGGKEAEKRLKRKRGPALGPVLKSLH